MEDEHQSLRSNYDVFNFKEHSVSIEERTFFKKDTRAKTDTYGSQNNFNGAMIDQK